MAGQIPQHFIDELLSRVDIVDVINLRVTLKKSGSNYMACCPFHNEKTPSFSVSQAKQFYHCFGCNANGSAIGFLMNYENMHFVDAIETLADSVGMEVPISEQASKARSDSKPLYTLLESVTIFYQAALRESPSAIDYLKARGLSGETAKAFAIGYAPDGWDALAKAFPDEEQALLKTGMLKTSDTPRAGKQDSSKAYQRFRNRIMFPIRDRRGRVIAFGGRVLGNDEPKYLNSPETPLFHKGSELYGLYEGRKAIQDAGMAIVVEGYMDVVALAQHGVHTAVATLGTATNQQHSETLFRVVPNIVFCFDGDRAGRAAAWRALLATLPCLQDGRDAHFLFLPDGEDPDSVVSSQGAAGFNELLAERLPIIDFLFQHLEIDVDASSIGGKAQLAEKAKPLLDTIPRGVYKQLGLQRLESLIGLSVGSQRAAASPARGNAAVRNSPVDSGRMTTMSRTVLLILQHPNIVSSLPADSFKYSESLAGADVLVRLVDYCTADSSITTARLLERFRDTPPHRYLSRLAARPYWPDNRELDVDTAVVELADCLNNLRTRSDKTMTDKVHASARKGLLAIRS